MEHVHQEKIKTKHGLENLDKARHKTRQDQNQKPKSSMTLRKCKKKKLQQTNQTTSLHMNKNHVVFCFLLLFLSLVSLFGQKTEFNFKGAKTNKNKIKKQRTNKNKKKEFILRQNEFIFARFDRDK